MAKSWIAPAILDLCSASLTLSALPGTRPFSLGALASVESGSVWAPSWASSLRAHLSRK